MDKQADQKKYETIVVFDHHLGEGVIKGESKKIQTLISTHGGNDLKMESWGRKEIPYITSRMADGFFVRYTYETTLSDTVHNIESVLRITDGIRRFQTHRTELKARKFKGNPKAKQTTLGSDDDFDLSDTEY